jgi:hypothetical protein
MLNLRTHALREKSENTLLGVRADTLGPDLIAKSDISSQTTSHPGAQTPMCGRVALPNDRKLDLLGAS